MPQKRAKQTTKPRTKPTRAAKAKPPKATPRAAGRPARARMLGAARGDGGPGSGLPAAPLTRLSLVDTLRRVKIIIGGQSGQDPDTITDESPVRRANILLSRLLVALNAHFFPPGLNGIVGFPPDETVEDLADRIKRTRDPQIS